MFLALTTLQVSDFTLSSQAQDATDTPAVDVLAGNAMLVDGAAYGNATGYLFGTPGCLFTRHHPGRC